jgi:hypothetical protein
MTGREETLEALLLMALTITLAVLELSVAMAPCPKAHKDCCQVRLAEMMGQSGLLHRVIKSVFHSPNDCSDAHAAADTIRQAQQSSPSCVEVGRRCAGGDCPSKRHRTGSSIWRTLQDSWWMLSTYIHVDCRQVFRWCWCWCRCR